MKDIAVNGNISHITQREHAEEKNVSQAVLAFDYRLPQGLVRYIPYEKCTIH